jgi:hypothetical protein
VARDVKPCLYVVQSVVAAHLRRPTSGCSAGRALSGSSAPRSAWGSMLPTWSRRQRDESPESGPQRRGGPDRAGRRARAAPG